MINWIDSDQITFIFNDFDIIGGINLSVFVEFKLFCSKIQLFVQFADLLKHCLFVCLHFFDFFYQSIYDLIFHLKLLFNFFLFFFEEFVFTVNFQEIFLHYVFYIKLRIGRLSLFFADYFICLD